ncbi:hypothetical protein DM860_006754 [Cuscuta australis]|uniref:Uncharacterized protein n=1 Tax=Cuscuta australis TaxID=267555 RepID=A0A328D5J2_9ASTE|nr:hypothetical protein DM860_006754 [Cuscuta australis]
MQNLDLAASECDDIKCLILTKDTDIKRNILYCEYPYFALDHGADAFPFADKKLREVSANHHLWWDDGDILPFKLEDLLGCSPSDVLNKTVSPGIHEKVTILELSSKVVGV